KEFSTLKYDAVRIYNEAFDFNGYYSYFKYYAVFPISNEVPYEVKRDYRILENENKGLKKYVENIVKTGKSNIDIIGVCEGIEGKCDYKNKIKNTELIGKLIQNNQSILDLYRNVVIGELKTNDYDYQLVSNNFEAEVKTNYSIASYSKCGEEEGGFFETISKSIANIGTLNKQGTDGIQKWEDAWGLLVGKDTSKSEYQKLEKDLLKKELSRQGVSGDNQQNMLEALDKYNSTGFSQNNNFIVNSYNNIKNKLEKEFKKFDDEIIGDFFEKEEGEEVSIKDINRASLNSEGSENIKKRIDTLYLEQSNFEGVSELNTDNTRARIISTYIEISNSINTLNKTTCRVAVKVCKAQDSSKGDCGECN
ncbi:MAG: hypothetical protein GY828_06060, partial [Candidatus Gracilibacteria bacterium]|nr:hypothetical protein [Candidatus Gracilibacteria bacterium]